MNKYVYSYAFYIQFWKAEENLFILQNGCFNSAFGSLIRIKILRMMIKLNFSDVTNFSWLPNFEWKKCISMEFRFEKKQCSEILSLFSIQSSSNREFSQFFYVQNDKDYLLILLRESDSIIPHQTIKEFCGYCLQKVIWRIVSFRISKIPCNLIYVVFLLPVISVEVMSPLGNSINWRVNKKDERTARALWWFFTISIWYTLF